MKQHISEFAWLPIDCEDDYVFHQLHQLQVNTQHWLLGSGARVVSGIPFRVLTATSSVSPSALLSMALYTTPNSPVCKQFLSYK